MDHLIQTKLGKLLVDSYATRMIYLQLRQFKEESSAEQKQSGGAVWDTGYKN